MPKDFVSQYCQKCHGEEKQKADRRFDHLSTSIEDFREQELWQEILDQLNLGEMPPEDENQPSEEEKLAIIEKITNGITEARERFIGISGHTVLRRLNKFEYRNTISDLLGLNTESWNPAADFPADVIVDGFDNDGAELVTSGLLLEKYFPAAEEAVVRATHLGKDQSKRDILRSLPLFQRQGVQGFTQALSSGSLSFRSGNSLHRLVWQIFPWRTSGFSSGTSGGRITTQRNLHHPGKGSSRKPSP